MGQVAKFEQNKSDQSDSRPISIMDQHQDPATVTAQVAFIKQVMKSEMKNDIHYGKVGGSPKPALFKAGAEKINLIFRLCPDYEIVEIERREDGFINYVIRCNLYHITSGAKIASGLGSCNSYETKYRYRWVEMPKPDEETQARMKALKKGKFMKSYDQQSWLWMEKMQNEDLADLDNTLLKMACKRALVASVLNGTAASEVFTQDLEDFENDDPGDTGEPKLPDSFGKDKEGDDAALKELGLGLEVKEGFAKVTGNTFNKKEELKALGFKFHNTKKCWYKSVA